MSAPSLLAASGAADVTAIAVTVVATIVVLGLVAVMVALLRATRQLRAVVDELARQSDVVLGELRGTVEQASGGLERVEGLLETAEAISSTVEGASRLAHSTFSTPVIKVLAAASGTARAARRLRDGPEESDRSGRRRVRSRAGRVPQGRRVD